MSSSDMIQKIYPLSPMQEGMLFHSLINDDKKEYFEQISFRISSELKIDLLEESLNKLIQRYDIFRTIFIYKGQNRPRQVVLKSAKIKMRVEDISDMDSNDQVKFIERLKEEDRNIGFDLSKEISIRSLVIKTNKEEYLFMLSFHHILLDGWSLPIVFNELFYIYNSLNKNIPLSLPKTNNYKNYIKWVESQDKEVALAFWSEYLENYEEECKVPKLINKIKKMEYVSDNEEFIIDKDFTNKLKNLASQNKGTVNLIFQAIWGIILGKYNKVEDVVFGSVVSGRPSEIEGIESMVGLFINTIPVRIKAEKNKKFVELLKEVQAASAKSKRYEYVQLSEIQSNTVLKQQLIDNIYVEQ